VSTRLMVIGIVCLVFAVLWLVSMVEVLTNDSRYRNATQLVWVLVLLLSGPVGAVLYQWLGPDRPHADDRPPPGRQARLDAITDPWSETRQP